MLRSCTKSVVVDFGSMTDRLYEFIPLYLLNGSSLPGVELVVAGKGKRQDGF